MGFVFSDICTADTAFFAQLSGHNQETQGRCLFSSRAEADSFPAVEESTDKAFLVVDKLMHLLTVTL